MNRFENTYQLKTLIEHLQAMVPILGPECPVTFCLGQHLYDIRCLETTGVTESLVEPEHTCVPWQDVDCSGCNDNWEPNFHLYLMAGDQHPYDKPTEFDSDLENNQ